MSELQLTDREWAVFKFIDIFDIKDGYYNKKPPKPLNTNEKIPFLGATHSNNGITGFYSISTIESYDKVGKQTSKDVTKRIYNANCIAITNNGSVGNAYYQPFKFTCSHDITPVYLKGYQFNAFIAKFMIPSIMNSGENFKYAKKWRPKRMKKSKLMLPINQEGKPDWQFMEDYIKQIELKQRKQINNYYKHLINKEIKQGGGG